MPPKLTKARSWQAGPVAELAGVTRDRLTFISWAGQDVRKGKRKTFWNMACSCGTRFVMRQDSLAKSCGCLVAETFAKGRHLPKRSWVSVEIEGRHVSLAEAARYHGLSYRTVRMRREVLRWPPERWFEMPQRMSHRERWRWRQAQKKRERKRASLR